MKGRLLIFSVTVCSPSSCSVCCCVGYQRLKSLWSFWFWRDLCEEVVIPVSWSIICNYAAAFLDLLNHDSQNHPEAVLALLTSVSAARHGLFLIGRVFERLRMTPALWKVLRDHVVLGMLRDMSSQSVSEARWAHCSSVVPELSRLIFLTWASYHTYLCIVPFRFAS